MPNASGSPPQKNVLTIDQEGNLERLREEIRQVVRSLQQQGIYPNETKVRKMVATPARWWQFKQVMHEVRQEIIKPPKKSSSPRLTQFSLL